MPEDTRSVVAKLLGSTKFVVAFLAIVAIVLLAGLGRIGGDQALDFVKWITTSWLASQAVEKVGFHVGKGLSFGAFPYDDGHEDGEDEHPPAQVEKREDPKPQVSLGGK